MEMNQDRKHTRLETAPIRPMRNPMRWVCLLLGGLLVLTGACTDGAVQSQSQPAPDATAASAVAPEPQLALEPAAGTAGTQVSVVGSGWKPGEMVLMVLEDVRGRSNVLAATIPDSTGAFQVSFIYPAATRWVSIGPHTVRAYTASATGQIASFQVLSPEELARAQQPTVTPTLALTHSISLPVALNMAPLTDPASISPTGAITAEAALTQETALTSTILVSGDAPPEAAPTLALTQPITAPEATPTPAPATDLRLRPEIYGRFFASQNIVPTLDGDLSEWSNIWYPIRAIVAGVGEHTGDADLSGEFQVSWGVGGLYLAVRVRDDAYRPGPIGTDMWQGDGLELHFDRLLALDFEDTTVNGDDYQIGITPTADNATIRSYRWIPQPREAVLSVPGAMRRNQIGYDIEAQIPWSYFDVSPGELSARQVFGFNVSINDNDGDVPAQQTIVSASPARTNHETPTEWGTLILGE